MDKLKPMHTVDKIEQQISNISKKLGDISPNSLKIKAEKIELKISKKKAFFDKHKKK